jgi:hypothetical protein
VPIFYLSFLKSILGWLSPLSIPPIWRFLRSFLYLELRYFQFKHWLVRTKFSNDECKVIKCFKQRENDSVIYLTAKTGQTIAPIIKTPNMGLSDFRLQLNQCLAFRGEISNSEKVAIQSLINKDILIEENKDPVTGDYVRVQLNYPYRRSQSDIDTIKCKNRNIQLPVQKSIDHKITNSYCPICNNKLVIQTYEGGTDFRCLVPRQCKNGSVVDFTKIYNADGTFVVVVYFIFNNIVYCITYKSPINISELSIHNYLYPRNSEFYVNVYGDYTGLSSSETSTLIDLLRKIKWDENRIWDHQLWCEKTFPAILGFLAYIMACIFELYC